MIELTNAWTPRVLKKNEVLWFEGDEAEELVFVESGCIEVIVRGRAVSAIGAGHFVGESSAFMSVSTRTATIQATQQTVVRVLSNQEIFNLYDKSPAMFNRLLEKVLITLAERVRIADLHFRRLAEGVEPRPGRRSRTSSPEHELSAIEQQLRHHAAMSALRSLPTLSDICTEEISELAGSLSTHVLRAGDTLCMEGDVRNSVYIVADGRLRFVHNIGLASAISVTHFERGMLVGVLSLLLNTARSATLIADEPTWILEMDRAHHDKLVGRVGRIWREMLFVSLRTHLTSLNARINQLELIRAERIRREYELDKSLRFPTSAHGWCAQDLTDPRRVHEKALIVLNLIARHRRLLPDSGRCANRACPECFAVHIDNVERAIANHCPVHFILPAFPAKSPNTDSKVLGTLPDMAEEQALRYLQQICDDIESVYAPGARVTICSDGRVFADLVLVGDDNVSAYRDSLLQMLQTLKLKSIDVFNLEDLFKVTDFDGMREHITVHYGEPIEQLRERIRGDVNEQAMFNGIHRFLFEDTLAVHNDKSRSKIRKECRERAYAVIQRSNAFSRLIGECFVHAIRLSIHPQHPHSQKIGIRLGKADGNWITPWHGIALERNGEFFLTSRAKAEQMGATLVARNGRPSHFQFNASLLVPDASAWESLYAYWFGNTIKTTPDYIQTRLPIWFFRNPQADNHINKEYYPWLNTICEQTREQWKQTARSFLTLIILFDQVPRNVLRGQADSFRYDDYARILAEAFIARGFIEQLNPLEAFWIYLPFQHHESLESQKISVEGIKALSLRCAPEHKEFFAICNDMAERHQDAIKQFGRFPHRNVILGRESSVAEQQFLEDPQHHF